MSSLGHSPPAYGTRERAAVLLLPFGGILTPLGWLLGVVLLWSSKLWTPGEKAIGTLLVPGGLLLEVPALFLLGSGTDVCHRHLSSSGHVLRVCGGGHSDAAFLPVVVALLVIPLLTAAFLRYRARGRASSAP